MAAYAANISEAVETVLEADQVAPVLHQHEQPSISRTDRDRKYMESTTTSFGGTASDLLKELNEIVPEAEQKSKGWPKRPNTLSKILRRIAPPLRKVGIDVRFDRDKDRRWMAITRGEACKTSSSSSSSSPLSNINNLQVTIPDQKQSPIRQASSSDDDGDDPEDDFHAGVATSKSAQCKGTDEGDANDDLFLTPAGERVCAQCNGLPDGTEQLCTVADQTVWLHRECQRFYIANQELPW
jgi:hypothetical protein